MAETKKADAKQPRPDTWVAFCEPYEFEGQTYEGVDIAPLLYERSTMTMIDAENYCERKGISLPPLPERSTQYIIVLLSLALNKPIEFFERLPLRSAVRLRVAVQGRFFRDFS